MREEVITREIIANPKSHYGGAKASTRHFILQRVTGAINIVFIGFLIVLVVSLAGAGREAMVTTVGSPWIGIPFAILLVVVTVHMRNGIRETFEDYFTGRMYRLLMLLNTIFAIAIALLGVGSILKLVFWG